MNEIDKGITLSAEKILTEAVDDYASKILEEISEDVISDVRETSGLAEGEDFSDGDVKLAIGRALCTRLGIAV